MTAHWTMYLSALLVPAVAIFGALIAYLQWRTAQNKLKLELFDRRLVVYDAALRCISAALVSGKLRSEEELDYLNGTRGARWLFDERVTNYLEEELWGKICDLGALHSELKDMPRGEERSRVIQAQADLKKWLIAQLKVLDRMFSPFLKLRH